MHSVGYNKYMLGFSLVPKLPVRYNQPGGVESTVSCGRFELRSGARDISVRPAEVQVVYEAASGRQVLALLRGDDAYQFIEK